MVRFRAVVVLCIVVLMALAIGVHVVSASVEEVIYKPGDWVRYRYIVRTSEETCVWIIRVSIREVNATHVRYDAGLEGMVSGGKLCEGLTSLLVIAPIQVPTHLVTLQLSTIEVFSCGTTRTSQHLSLAQQRLLSSINL
jgi:hypothetical protein